MASLSRSGGLYTVQFYADDGKRRSVRLGRVDKRSAEGVCRHVGNLATAKAAGQQPPKDTAVWLGEIGSTLRNRLAKVGLVEPERRLTLGDFLAAYLTARRADSKPATVVNLGIVSNDLTRYFGERLELRAVTAERAHQFRTHYQTRTPKLAADTVARRLRTVRHLFAHAVKLKLIPDSPFRDVTARSANPGERKHYVSPAAAGQLIAAANPTWRIIVALCRYGGLRCPSEVLSLKWEHVDFAAGRMTVTSPKTEHLPGKAYRVVPFFPELAPHLADAFDLAEPGEVFVVGGRQGATYRAAADTPRG